MLVADPELRDLSSFRTRQHFKAGKGGAGGGSSRHGASGEAVELRVPVGTQVLDEDEQLVADLVAPGARVAVARGGAGGRGNRRFATPTRQTPRFAETGIAGEEADARAAPEAARRRRARRDFRTRGSRRCCGRISNAKPKVADYPFTTLQPVLGTVESDERQLVVADVPGLIEGASEGVGLGHEFLAHLERARLLVHVIDAAAGDPAEAFEAIDRELEAYGAGLAERPQVVVLNKLDLMQEAPPFETDDPRVVRVFAAFGRDR